MFKSLNQLDRHSYWKRAAPIVVRHLLFAFAATQGISFFNAFDTALIFFLAAALAGRFRDIGWPIWIGPSFLLVTMIVLPIGILAYAIASGEKGRDILPWMFLVGWFTGPANLLLLLVAGCVPGKPAAADLPQDSPSA